MKRLKMRVAIGLGVAGIAAGAAAMPASARIPSTPTGAWAAYQGVIASNGTGAVPGVVIVGDSLVAWGNAGAFADTMRFITGRNTVVGASAGSSMSHWVTPSLIQPLNMPLLQDLTNFAANGVAVIALGTNDARLMDADANYKLADYAAALNKGIDGALVDAKCVVVVNTSSRVGQANRVRRQSVNSTILSVNKRGGRVLVGDWDAYSAGRADWFSGDNVHHTAAGSEAYRAFMSNQVVGALNNQLCK